MTDSAETASQAFADAFRGAREESYARLPETFFARLAPTPVAAATALQINESLAAELGLSPAFLASREGVEILAGNHVPDDAEPLAMAYAGHQFGNWVPSLGDGRAVLLGELIDRKGVRRDIHLKGAGPTPFSRRGDGRAALGPVLREYVVSEAMAGLGIPTTRALAMLSTGEPVQRERAEPGAVIARVASSHVRVGTFQYFYARGQHDSVRTLADYVIGRLLPSAREAPNPYRALLDEVIRRQADLIARWLLVGFIHGVMNTDNVSIAGETIDYGPCAFMDRYRPATVYSSIDHAGRYAYDQQPAIGLWNLSRFAETLLPLLGSGDEQAEASAREALEAYGPRFEGCYREGLCAKLGLFEAGDEDLSLAQDLLKCMAQQGADFTLTFRGLSEVRLDDDSSLQPIRRLHADAAAFDAWAKGWRSRLQVLGRADAERRSDMRSRNPAYIPRNHRVQQAIDAATVGNMKPFEDLLTVTTRPYDDHLDLSDYRRPPEPQEVVQQTFCGT
jgi:uncharacterized protein YdiU (UPF0061 family)